MRHPLLDVGLFRNARFTAASLSVTAAFFALFGFIFLITQYLQLVQGYSPLEAGIRTLPFAIATGATSPLGHRGHAPLGVEGGGGRRARHHVAGLRPRLPDRGRHPLPGPHPRQHGDDRHRPRAHDRPGHGVDHGRAARGQGRRRLRGQRHDPRARRHAGRRRGRLRLRERLRRGARRLPAVPRTSRRAPGRRGRVDGRRAHDRAVAAGRRRRARGGCRPGGVHRRAGHRLTRRRGGRGARGPSWPSRSCPRVTP